MPTLRPEIQALRALAVTLVVGHHLWPGAIPGGFAGVDVFFAISGYVITAQLLRELDRSGRVSLRRFWARRARRILPAALVVLLAAVVATLALVPQLYWAQFLAEIRASATYVQNWHLAASSVDYFAAGDGPSPVQHFWSLSAEEQFYLAWPVLLGAVALAAGWRRRTGALAMGGLTVASFAYGLRLTAHNPSLAYFLTPGRAWEFGLGGLLALRAPSATPSRGLSVIGLGAIAVAAGAYSPSTAFPGAAALLPVLGALAVIAAGHASRPLAAAPVQRLGDLSYSVYLWHWPLLVLAPFVVAAPSRPSIKVAIVMLTLLLAWLSKTFVEDPLRGRASRRGARIALPFAGVATVAVLAACSAGAGELRTAIHRAELASSHLLASRPPCFGAAARGPRPCDNPRLRLAVVPTPLQARDRRNAPCRLIGMRDLLYVCSFGAPRSRATRTIALIGDSHASHWRAALDPVARARGWYGISLTHSGCPFNAAIAMKALREPARSQCQRWNREVAAWLRAHREVTTVFVSAISGSSWVPAHGRSAFETAVAGFAAAWRALPPTVRQVVVIRDTPKASSNTAPCVMRAIAEHRRAGVACALPRAVAITPDAEAVAAARLRSRRVGIADLTRFICDARLCYPVVGGALVYKDEHHMTTVFARTLAPYLGRRVDALVPADPAPRRQ
ncbi:MAG: hypothetical protein QOE28_2399 [Solirubrobacteraceae bacterium]|nr:hypothetical protein [Solirubrobacteraceae bacterium]